MATYKFGLLGDPVEHSRSPDLHRAMLRLTGNDGDYLLVRADDRRLAGEIAELRSRSWDGLNVTMPLKECAAALADELDPAARLAGSVNTLVLSGEVVKGHSTDVTAFSDLLARPGLEGETLLVLGAGGSAGAALAAAAGQRPVYISARDIRRATALVDRLGGEAVPWGAPVAGAVVVNATPIGMSGESLDREVLAVAAGIIDLPYGSDTTPAVAFMRRRDLPAIDGHEFLLRQAIASFHLWTGAHVEFDEVLAAIRKA